MSKCALDTDTNTAKSCLSDEHRQLISTYAADLRDIESRCASDECVLETAPIPADVRQRIEREAFKAPAKRLDSQYWLNNTEIDTVMSQLRQHFPGFAHSFIHMSDLVAFDPSNASSFDYPVYAVKQLNLPQELQHACHCMGLDLPDAEHKLSTFGNAPLTAYGVVCNTDTSRGGGQHWFCIFISTDHPDPEDTSRPWIRIELFNSAGGGCDRSEFNQFWETQAMEISRATGCKCTFDTVTTIQHQHSDTGNCGSYSLFYIYARLNGCLPSEFDDPKKPITDYAMSQFRKVCFRADDSSSIL